MKTKIALSASPTDSQTFDGAKLVPMFKAIFGATSSSKKTAEAHEYAWNKANVQLYIYANGNVGVLISVSDMPTLEFDGAKPNAARTRVLAWVKAYQKMLDKQTAAIDKIRQKLVTAAASL